MEFVHKVDNNGLTGEICYKILPVKERFEAIKKISYKMVGEELKPIDDIDKSIALIDIAKENIVKIDCKCDGYEFKDFEILSCDSRGTEEILKVGSFLINGTILGKS